MLVITIRPASAVYRPPAAPAANPHPNDVRIGVAPYVVAGQGERAQWERLNAPPSAPVGEMTGPGYDDADTGRLLSK